MWFCVIIVLLKSSVQSSASEYDFCEPDSDHCDQEGLYKHIGITSYEDFKIRKELDDDADLIQIRSSLSLSKIEKTINKYPNSPRAKLNKLFALQAVYSQENNLLPYSEYISTSNSLYSMLTSMEITPFMYTLVCTMWMEMVEEMNDVDGIVKATSSCLRRPDYLETKVLSNIRNYHVINKIILREYDEALDTMAMFQDEYKRRDEGTKQVDYFLQIAEQALLKSLRKEPNMDVKEKLKKNILKLREGSAEMFIIQKEKYENLIKLCSEESLGENTKNLFLEAAVEAGMFLSMMQRPTTIVGSLRSKPVWDLSELNNQAQTLIKDLQKNWEKVLYEGEELREKQSMWMKDDNLIVNGTWDVLQYIGGK